jgi:phosphohistidine phosphatase
MRTIYLLRHAKSSWRDETLADVDRPLSKRGRQAAKAMRDHLAEQRILPAQILCSPARRTRDTLTLVQEAFPAAVPVRFERGIYLADPQTLLRRLRRLSESLTSVMVVGHNPGLELLALMLSQGRDNDHRRDLAVKFPTCALAVLGSDADQWTEVRPGACDLTDFVIARDLIPA